MPPNRFTRIYLNDHRSAAAAGLALIRRCLDSNRHTQLGHHLRDLVEAIEADARALDEVIRELGLPVNPAKRWATLLAERLGLLKLNGKLRSYSPLSRVLELEALLAGIDAKRSLWSSLRTLREEHPTLAAFDFDLLAQRAADQHDELVPHHRRAAEEAFGSTA